MADRKKMEGHCSVGQSPQWAIMLMEEEEEEEEEEEVYSQPHKELELLSQ